MSKPSTHPTQQVDPKKTAEAGEFETKVLAKSEWPKTPKETIKMVLNFLSNFFPF